MSAGQITCLACGTDAARSILEIDRAPVLCNQLCSTEAEAHAAQVAPIQLANCTACGHTFNATFDPGRIQYGPDYENSLHFSPRFLEYSSALVAGLTARHDLGGRPVVEVGCGDGSFLRELCAASEARGHGFDPSYDGPGEVDGRVSLSPSSFFESETVPDTALVCNRHVLEHVQAPGSFVSAIADKLGPGSGSSLYLEVPNGLYTLRDLGIWDVIYEHPSYFCSESLRRVVQGAGFGEVEVHESFGGQFLGLHARLNAANAANGPRGATTAEVAELADRFADAYREKVEHWKQVIQMASAGGRHVALWSAGSKGNSFLNVLNPGPAVQCVVDVNPKKQGHFMAGTGHPIVAPQALTNSSVDLVILMNPIYAVEVREMLDAVRPEAELVVA